MREEGETESSTGVSNHPIIARNKVEGETTSDYRTEKSNYKIFKEHIL